MGVKARECRLVYIGVKAQALDYCLDWTPMLVVVQHDCMAHRGMHRRI